MLEARGAFAEAEPLRRRVLDGFERQLGPEHRETLASVQNLAFVLECLGQFHEAPLLRRAAGSGGRVAFCFGKSWEKLQGNIGKQSTHFQIISILSHVYGSAITHEQS